MTSIPTLYDTTLAAGPGARVLVETEAGVRQADLYSPDGLALVAGLWLKLSAEYGLMYGGSWLGVPIIQLPGDIVAMQELLWKTRPDVVVECGFAHGGSAVLYASILELLGKGVVIGVDVEVRRHNRAAVESHPLSKRIRIVEGSSIDPRTVSAVGKAAEGAASVLVVLDSNHDREHVLAEMEAYHGLVTPDSYLVAMDGAQAHVWDVPRAKPGWRDSNPLQAIEAFLAAHPEFDEDPRYHRGLVTSSPRGFLRRKRQGEASWNW